MGKTQTSPLLETDPGDEPAPPAPYFREPKRLASSASLIAQTEKGQVIPDPAPLLLQRRIRPRILQTPGTSIAT